ncbi:MAG: O-antigen ligase family protein [Clostridia bacterium]|nr:O-antigen ligase family protein [Clostridia bacterium]
MKKIKKLINSENLLSLIIIICPILDIASFLFRNKFNTNYSISTFIRPIIPMFVFMYLFFKRKDKLKIIGIAVLYTLYGLIHLYLYKKMMTDCTFGTVIHEAQYIVNYSFMILNLFIFGSIISTESTKKIQKSMIISLSIYIVLIYISIITHTSSTTYIEGIGFKGWFESGNSISAILVLSTFIILSFLMKIESKKTKVYATAILALVGIYLITLIGTRVGLFGFVLAIVCFIIAQLAEKMAVKIGINKKNLFILLTILVLLVILVITAGSVTIKRRQHLKNMENTIIDESTGNVSHLTGDLTVIRNKIVNNELEEGFMTEAQKQSILDLYDYAEKYNISNTNTRMQQLIYHGMLVKNQKNPLLVLFGNGYLINTNELVWEMEFPAFIFNFGILGFLLYMVPFLYILFKALKAMIKNFKNTDAEFTMLLLAVILSFILSTLSGYTFFNSSSMIIIIIANVLLNNKIKEVNERCEK